MDKTNFALFILCVKQKMIMKEFYGDKNASKSRMLSIVKCPFISSDEIQDDLISGFQQDMLQNEALAFFTKSSTP